MSGSPCSAAVDRPRSPDVKLLSRSARTMLRSPLPLWEREGPARSVGGGGGDPSLADTPPLPLPQGERGFQRRVLHGRHLLQCLWFALYVARLARARACRGRL